MISFFDCYCAQVLCATQQSPIQSQFEQSLLTVQNAAQRTFSLLFPLLRLGRSAQVSCAVRGPFVISSLRMDLYLSELYHHLCDLQSVWGKNYLPVVGSVYRCEVVLASSVCTLDYVVVVHQCLSVACICCRCGHAIVILVGGDPGVGSLG